MSSRVFIRGLPSKFTDKDLKSHFEKVAPVTDTKLLPKRRIGYVGFKTESDAEKAVKFFDKSFVRMTRISVELAKSANDDALPRAWSAHTHGTTANKRKAEDHDAREAAKAGSNGQKKKKEDELRDVHEDPKLKEFLQVMQPSAGSRTWTNDDTTMFEANELPVTSAKKDEIDQDDDYDTLLINSKAPVVTPSSQPAVTEAMPSTATTVTAASDAEEAEDDEPKPEISDEDWLRSRTSRTLDLVDHTEQHASASRQVPVPMAEPVQVEESHSAVEAQIDIDDRRASETEATIETISETGRLFVRNLAYSVTEEELEERFGQFGELQEVHIVADTKQHKAKGFAYIQYKAPSDAINAFKVLDKTIFQGRLLHILGAKAKRETKLDDFALSKLPLKKQRELKRKAAATTNTFSWNSMYMNADAVMSSVAHKLGVSKSEIFDPTSSDAAVVQAHAETHVIQETKAFFEANGINLESFQSKKKDDCIILIKNFPFGTTVQELKDLLKDFGPLGRVLMPPGGTIAIAEFLQAAHGRAAFSSLAFRRFKETILFLEKGPIDLFKKGSTPSDPIIPKSSSAKEKVSAQDLLAADAAEEGTSTSLYVRNLNFTTTSEGLAALFSPLEGYITARVSQKPNPKAPGQTLSMGFGFAEFRTVEQANAAMAALDGHIFDGHALSIKKSHQGAEAASQKKSDEKAKKAIGTKLIIKNLPFEANKKDVYSLFGKYGKLRSVRLPKKFGGRSGGFAFAEFASARDAKTAFEALKDTHLLGRRLVLEPAQADAADGEEEIQRMISKAEKQSGVMRTAELQKTMKRSKFEIDGAGEDDDL